MEIIPAILPKSYDEVEEKIALAAGHVPSIQIDVCDGGYVSSRTWPYVKGAGNDAIFDEIVSQEKALPHWEEVDFEFDLMVKGAYEKIPDFISAGASRVIVHRASVGEDELQSIIRDYGKRSEELGVFDIELGIALQPSAKAEYIKDIVHQIHFVQVMGIERIGFQGEKMGENTVELVKSLRSLYPSLPISVDGGVNLETAAKLKDAGATRLVVGSALFGNEDFLGTLKMLKAI